jgi:hypothetical protein
MEGLHGLLEMTNNIGAVSTNPVNALIDHRIRIRLAIYQAPQRPPKAKLHHVTAACRRCAAESRLSISDPPNH